MNKDRAADITTRRLDEWAGLLRPCVATPVVLLAVGHGDRAGTLHVCVPEDVTDEHLVYWLHEAAATITRRLAGDPRVMDARVTFNVQPEGGAK